MKSLGKILTLNTHKGLFRPTRLTYGVNSASGIDQRNIEQVLKECPMTVVRVDDILVTGKDDQEHLKNLNIVLSRLADACLTLKREKCKFLQPSVTYLGYCINKNGIHPTKDKFEAIRNAPAPTNVSELRFFLGMITYYQKFLENYSTLVHSLNQLLQKGMTWSWTDKCQSVFEELKEKLSRAPVLAHYDLQLPLKLYTDASAHEGWGQ